MKGNQPPFSGRVSNDAVDFVNIYSAATCEVSVVCRDVPVHCKDGEYSLAGHRHRITSVWRGKVQWLLWLFLLSSSLAFAAAPESQVQATSFLEEELVDDFISISDEDEDSFLSCHSQETSYDSVTDEEHDEVSGFFPADGEDTKFSGPGGSGGWPCDSSLS